MRGVQAAKWEFPRIADLRRRWRGLSEVKLREAIAMGLTDQLAGRRLMLTKPTGAITKGAEVKVSVQVTPAVILMSLVCVLIALAIMLYVIGQPEAGRAVIDLATGIVGWIVGRGTGEKAGLSQGQD